MPLIQFNGISLIIAELNKLCCKVVIFYLMAVSSTFSCNDSLQESSQEKALLAARGFW